MVLPHEKSNSHGQWGLRRLTGAGHRAHPPKKLVPLFPITGIVVDENIIVR